MPRPCKRRRVCAMPGCRRFSPAESSGEKPVELSVDEFETVRLIDYEALDQAACAERMGVARTTVQAIHSRALGRIAAALVEGRELEIGGGDFFVCDGSERMGCGRHACCCQQPRRTVAPHGQEGSIMRIAVPYDNGQVFQHFGYTQVFKVYEVEDGKVSYRNRWVRTPKWRAEDAAGRSLFRGFGQLRPDAAPGAGADGGVANTNVLTLVRRRQRSETADAAG